MSQVHLGIYLTQKKFFQSFLIFWEAYPNMMIPIFPGGRLLGIILFFNLLSVIYINKLYQTITIIVVVYMKGFFYQNN